MNVDTEITLAEDYQDNAPLKAPPAPPARPSLTNLPPPPKRRSSIKDRFEDAKREQQRVEEERLEKLKHKDAISPKGNVAGMWNNALANSKTNESERFQAKRRETISQFQTAEAAGIVANRVKHFEELYMQLAASIEKMEATIRAARRNAKKWKMAATSPLKKTGMSCAAGCGVQEDSGIKIRVGETATFWFDPQYFSFVNAMLAKNNDEPIALPVGVYSDETAPHIDVVAVCILDSSSNEPYLAITVDYCDGEKGEPLALGRKKIAVFATDHLKADTGVEDLVQVFSEVFVVLSIEDIGVSAIEMMEAENEENEEDMVISDSFGACNDVADIDATDFPGVSLCDPSKTNEFNSAAGTEIASAQAVLNDESLIYSEEEVDKTLVDDSEECSENDEGALDDTLIDPVYGVSHANNNKENDISSEGTTSANKEYVDDFHEHCEIHVDKDAEDTEHDECNVLLNAEESTFEHPTAVADVSEPSVIMDTSAPAPKLADDDHLVTSPTRQDKIAPAEFVTPSDSVGDDVHTPIDSDNRASRVSTANSEADDFVPHDLKSPLTSKNRLKSSSNVGLIFSFSGLGSLAPEVRTPVVIRADSQKVSPLDQQSRRLSWDAKDERDFDLPLVQKINLSFDISKILAVSCSASCCLFICRPEHINDTEGDYTDDSVQVQTLAITGTMKHSVFNSQMMIVDSACAYSGIRSGNVDTVFEWVRDAAFSGWGYKWPMLRQKVGLRTKRFFILRNDLLSYHAREPRSKEEAHADYAMHSLRLRPGSTVTKTRRYLQDCLEVATPVDTLWFKSSNKRNHNRWVALIQAAVEHYSRGPVFLTKDRVECAWQHELPECCCVAVDAAVPIVGSFVRLSLYRIELETSKKNDVSNLESQGGRYTYIIDYNRTGDVEPSVMPLIMDSIVSLSCVKLVGEDVILLGGKNGYVGVCDYGDSEVTNRQFEGHSVDTSVICMASCNQRNFAVCGDDGGGLSLWMCTRTPERVRCITAIGGESTGRDAINTIQFIPNRDLVAVSTRTQYLLFGLRVSDTGCFELEGVSVLDVNSLFVTLGSDVSPIKSLPSFGLDPDSEIYHCHSMAFPHQSDSTGASIRHDLGGLKVHTSTPPRSATATDMRSLPIVVWKASGAPSKVANLAGPTTSVWRIECDYEWIDMRASAMVSVAKFAADRNIQRTLSGNIVPIEESVAVDEYGIDVDFSIVHQV